ADQARRQLSEERQHLLTSELPGDDDLALGIDAVDLEHLLCKVEPDAGNSCHGRPSLVIRLQRSLYGTSMPCEAPSTSSNATPTSCPLLKRKEPLTDYPMGETCQLLNSADWPIGTVQQRSSFNECQ